MPNPSSRAQTPPTYMIVVRNVYLVTNGGYLLSASDGGGHITDDAIQTHFKYAVGTPDTAPSPLGTFESFNVWKISTGLFAFETSGGNFITAVSGGGRTTDVIHTDALGIDVWEEFRIAPTGSSGAFSVSIQTHSKNFLTAVGMGGKTTNAILSDAVAVGTWENFFVRKWHQDFGAIEYFIVDANKNQAIAARGGGGQTQNTIQFVGESGVPLDWARFTLLLQSDGSFALRTVNGHYLTAVNGGGLDYGTTQTDNIHTDATVAKAWEQFRFIQSDDGTFLIQTVSGYYLGKAPTAGVPRGNIRPTLVMSALVQQSSG